MIRPISLLLCALGALVAGCATSQSVIDTDGPVEVSFYHQGRRQLSIVNEAHSNRVELYSKKATSASTKVASNEVMDALLDRFADNEFFEMSQNGNFGGIADGRALEVLGPNGSVYFHVGKNSSPEQWKSFASCREAFVDLYNGIFAPQSVENTQGESIFGTQRNR